MREAFEGNFAKNLERGAQLSVFQNGEAVVDLYGHSNDLQALPYSYDGATLQTAFSSGKNLEALAVMILVDRGLLSYTDTIAEHWPAFGAHGKDHITVEDLMRHESGLQFFADPAAPHDLKRWVAVEGVLVRQPTEYREGQGGAEAPGGGECVVTLDSM